MNQSDSLLADDEHGSSAESMPCSSLAAAMSRRLFLERTLGSVAGATAFALLTRHAQAQENDTDADKKGAPLIATQRDDGSWLLAGSGQLATGDTLSFLFGNKEAPGILLALPNEEPTAKPDAPAKSDAPAKADAAPRLVALSALCTHGGCAVEWLQDKGQFNCPCHRSRFDTAGKVLKGPAKKPLPLFTVRVEGADAILTPA